jgi:probable rRNA maturation factor
MKAKIRRITKGVDHMSLNLGWNNEQADYEINDELITMLERLLQIAAEQEQTGDGEVSLSFVNDEAIQQLNKDYRGIDSATDVLSFSMLELGDDELAINYDELEEVEDEEDADEEDNNEAELDSLEASELFYAGEALGDIVISAERAIAQSEEYGHSVEREIGFLFVHGFLHLIGYDHGNEEEEREMFRKQEEILQKAGLIR